MCGGGVGDGGLRRGNIWRVVPCAIEKNFEAISYLFFDLWFEGSQ